MLTPDQGFLDRRISQEARTLAERGWSVDIYATHDDLEPPSEMLAENVRMLPRPPQPRASTARRLKHLLRDSAPGLHRIADSAQARFTDRAEQTANWNLDHLLAYGPYEAVFAHDIPVLPLAIRLKTAWGCAVICDLHEIYPEMDTTASAAATRAYWRRVEATYLPQADGILCVNAAVEQHVRDAYPQLGPIGIVHNSVPYVANPHRPYSDIKATYGISDERRVLAFAGRIEADTNVATLVAGFGEARIDGWLLVLLGTGSIREELTTLVIGSGLSDRVYLGRRVPEQELVPTLASAAAGALPYLPVDRNHLISTPNKLFEYAQARLPIATSRLPMIERLITSNGNGSFVDYSSPASTAEGLRRFVRDELPTFEQSTLELAARTMSWESDEDSFLGLVEQVLAGQRAIRP
jgi:starch synthase